MEGVVLRGQGADAVGLAEGLVLVCAPVVLVRQPPAPHGAQLVMIGVHRRARGKGSVGIGQPLAHLFVGRIHRRRHQGTRAVLLVDGVPAPVIAVYPRGGGAAPSARVQPPVAPVVQRLAGLARKVRGRAVQFAPVTIAVCGGGTSLRPGGQPPPGVVGPRFRCAVVQRHARLLVPVIIPVIRCVNDTALRGVLDLLRHVVRVVIIIPPCVQELIGAVLSGRGGQAVPAIIAVQPVGAVGVGSPAPIMLYVISNIIFIILIPKAYIYN